MPRLPGIVWDINQVLNYIKSLPHNRDLTLMQLSAKTVFLLLICTTRRHADVMAIHLGYIFKDANRFVCQLQVLSKTYSLTNTSVQNLEIVKFPNDKYAHIRHCLGTCIVPSPYVGLVNGCL